MRDKLRYFLTLQLLILIISNRFLGCHATHFFSTLCDRYDVFSDLVVWSSECTYVLFAQPLPVSLDRVIEWDINFDIFRFYICQFHWQPFLRMSRDAFFLAWRATWYLVIYCWRGKKKEITFHFGRWCFLLFIESVLIMGGTLGQCGKY